jgi:hypothetical protein
MIIVLYWAVHFGHRRRYNCHVHFFFFFFFGYSKALESRVINDDIDRDEFDVSISTRGFEKH